MINIKDCNQGEFTDYYRQLSFDTLPGYPQLFA